MSKKPGFAVEVLEFSEIHTLPGTWGRERYRELLERLDFDDIEDVADADLADMATMAAQDKGVRFAADQVLVLVFGDALSAGVRQNLIEDLKDEKPWDHFADLDRQAGVFETVDFLQRAFPREFGIPDAARVLVRVTAASKQSAVWLQERPKASLLLRLLADAMGEQSTLRRLFEEQLDSTKFPEADSLIWLVSKTDDRLDQEPATCEFEIHSSLQWLGPLRDVRGETASDAEPDD